MFLKKIRNDKKVYFCIDDLQGVLPSTFIFHPISDYAVQKEAELKMLTEKVKTGGKGMKANEKQNVVNIR